MPQFHTAPDSPESAQKGLRTIEESGDGEWPLPAGPHARHANLDAWTVVADLLNQYFTLNYGASEEYPRFGVALRENGIIYGERDADYELIALRGPKLSDEQGRAQVDETLRLIFGDTPHAYQKRPYAGEYFISKKTEADTATRYVLGYLNPQIPYQKLKAEIGKLEEAQETGKQAQIGHIQDEIASDISNVLKRMETLRELGLPPQELRRSIEEQMNRLESALPPAQPLEDPSKPAFLQASLQPKGRQSRTTVK